jgi:hypothetical protein
MRIHERRIARADVEAAIREPDLKRTAKRGKLEVIKQLGSRQLRVFYIETPKAIIFVTAYWSRA